MDTTTCPGCGRKFSDQVVRAGVLLVAFERAVALVHVCGRCRRIYHTGTRAQRLKQQESIEKFCSHQYQVAKLAPARGLN